MLTGVKDLEMPVELYQALHTHFEKAGVASDLLSQGNHETPDGEMGLGLKDRVIDFVQVGLPSPVDVPPEVERMMADVAKYSPEGRTTQKGASGREEFMFKFFLKGNLTRGSAEISTELKGKKKGIISRKLIDVSWSGGLSKDLAPNKALKDQLLTSGVDNLIIEAIPMAYYVKIAHIHKVRYVRRQHKVSYEELPSLQKFNTIEMIAQHIRSTYMG